MTRVLSAHGGTGEASQPDFWLQEQLGFEVHGDPHGARVTIECDDRHRNPHGVVHGAVIFAILDTGMGAATMAVVPAGARCATIEIQTRFLAPVVSGTLEASIKVIKAGRRVVHLEGSVRDGDGALVAMATGSFAVLVAG